VASSGTNDATWHHADDIALHRWPAEVGAIVVDLEHEPVGGAGEHVAPPDRSAEREPVAAPDRGDHPDVGRLLFEHRRHGGEAHR